MTADGAAPRRDSPTLLRVCHAVGGGRRPEGEFGPAQIAAEYAKLAARALAADARAPGATLAAAGPGDPA